MKRNGMMEINLRNFMFVWTPNKVFKGFKGNGTEGLCQVGIHGDGTGWHDGFLYSDGNCFNLKEDSDDEILKEILIMQSRAVIRDGVDPKQMYGQFLKIKEYRELVEQ